MRKNLSHKGMTLIEVLVWIIVFYFTLIGILSSIQYLYRVNTYSINQATAVASAQRGIDKMVRVIRETSYAANGAYPVISMSAHTFSVYSDVDSDQYAEKVRFYVEAGELKQGTIEAAGDPPTYSGAEAISVLSPYVRNLEASLTTFHYYDENGTEILNYTNVGDVRFVTVDMIVDVDPTKTPTTLNMRTSAMLRNLR